jgi:hypothetical protein
MTDDKKKHDDNDRKKVSDEEMEDVAGGIQEYCANGTFLKPKRKKILGSDRSDTGTA